MCFVLLLLFFFFKQKTAYEMRISDWSSDVCSSDLRGVRQLPCSAIPLHTGGPSGSDPIANAALCGGEPDLRENGGHPRSRQPSPLVCQPFYNPDRKSVVSGKSVSVRVDLGGRRFIKKQNQKKTNRQLVN